MGAEATIYSRIDQQQGQKTVPAFFKTDALALLNLKDQPTQGIFSDNGGGPVFQVQSVDSIIPDVESDLLPFGVRPMNNDWKVCVVGANGEITPQETEEYMRIPKNIMRPEEIEQVFGDVSTFAQRFMKQQSDSDGRKFNFIRVQQSREKEVEGKPISWYDIVWIEPETEEFAQGNLLVLRQEGLTE